MSLMSNLSKLILGAAFAVASVTGASAATVHLTDGGVYNPFDTKAIYIYEEAFAGSGGAETRTFVFTVDAADAPLPVLASNVTLTTFATIVNPYMSWSDGINTITEFLEPIIFQSQVIGYGSLLKTVFSAPDRLTQTLTIGWASHSGPVQISLQVAAVPLPAGGLLLLGALGGLAFVRRRQTAATA
jgi:hypothetical protein